MTTYVVTRPQWFHTSLHAEHVNQMVDVNYVMTYITPLTVPEMEMTLVMEQPNLVPSSL